MLESAQQRSAQHEAATPTPAHESAPAVEQQHQPAAHTVPPAASFAAMTGQPAVAGAPAQEAPLANHDAMVEQLSHGMVDKELDGADETFLRTNGYSAEPIRRGAHEFVMRTFLPLPNQAGKDPVVAFRGTVPTKVQTVIADLDPSGIGMYQFKPNQPLIEGQMRSAATHGKIISTGHSLGGALAQIAAATFPGLVGSIVTFQAPGVSREMAKKIVDYNAEHPDAQIESSHHRVQGDLVPMGGQALTPGEIHNHQMTGGSALSRNPLSKHTSMPLAQEEIAAGHNVPIHGDHGSVATGDVTTAQDNATKSQGIERVRTGIGAVGYGVGGAVSAVGHATATAGRAIGHAAATAGEAAFDGLAAIARHIPPPF
jgi:Lipase (class 3)